MPKMMFKVDVTPPFRDIARQFKKTQAEMQPVITGTAKDIARRLVYLLQSEYDLTWGSGMGRSKHWQGGVFKSIRSRTTGSITRVGIDPLFPESDLRRATGKYMYAQLFGWDSTKVAKRPYPGSHRYRASPVMLKRLRYWFESKFGLSKRQARGASEVLVRKWARRRKLTPGANFVANVILSTPDPVFLGFVAEAYRPGLLAVVKKNVDILTGFYGLKFPSSRGSIAAETARLKKLFSPIG